MTTRRRRASSGSEKRTPSRRRAVHNASSPPPPPDARLPYVAPWRSFLFIVAFFIFFNYLAVISSQVEQEDYWTVLPPYMSRLEARSVAANRKGEWCAAPLSILCWLLFYFQKVVVVMGPVGRALFRSKANLQIGCALCWIIHCYEAGVCFHLCRRCNAATWTSVKYLAATMLGGFCQLTPLKQVAMTFLEAERERRESVEKLKKQ